MAYDYLDGLSFEERQQKCGQAYNIAIGIRDSYRRNGGIGPFTEEDIAELTMLIGQYNYGMEAKYDLLRWMLRHNVM